MEIQQGTITTERYQITKIMTDFYKNLYTSEGDKPWIPRRILNTGSEDTSEITTEETC